MQNSTKENLKQNAQRIIGEHPNNVDAAHSAFTQFAETQFSKNADGLSRTDYLSEASQIWDQVKLQAGSRPGQGSQQDQRTGR